MAKGILGGMTDYNHQSFFDILHDLEAERKRTIAFRNAILSNKTILEKNSYWEQEVAFDFKVNVNYALQHYNTTITEITDILNDFKKEVKTNHIARLARIGSVASEINVDIGKAWHQRYDNKDYGNENFRIVENIYADTRDMAVNLLDMSNIAERLNDFIGKSMKKDNPWITGSFYLVLAVVLIVLLTVVSRLVHWSILPLIIIGGILLIGLVGILQLKNDDKIADKTFVSLIKETYKRLPLLKHKS